jgi:succinate dehydrogenase/fumarate reductase flavoprotein subunit
LRIYSFILHIHAIANYNERNLFMAEEYLIETDILIIGGALAGLFTAIKARDEGVSVTVVEKNYAGKTGGAVFAHNTSFFNPEWGHNLKDWMTQIAETGDYMNNPELTEITLKESYDRYQDLVDWGIKLPRDKDGKLILLPAKKGVLEAYNVEWREVLPFLRSKAIKSGAKIMDRIMITDLLKQDGRIVGAVGFHTQTGDFHVFKSKATVLCTGTGTLGLDEQHPGLSTYDGEALAYRAGAEVSGKEFTISGLGAYSYAGTGYGIYGDRKEGNAKISLEGKKIKTLPEPGWSHLCMYIDKHVDSQGYKVNRSTFPTSIHLGRGPVIWNLDDATQDEIDNIFKAGKPVVDVTKRGLYYAPIRFEGYVGWAVHGATGVSSTDNNGGTNLPGLFAVGDVYNSKAVGAKYPHGGFGTRNAMVIGTRTARSAAEFAKKSGKVTLDSKQVSGLKAAAYAPLERQSGFDPRWVKLQLKTITHPYYVWVIKHGDRLKAALTLVEFVKNHLTPMIYARDIHGLRLAHEAKGAVQCIEMMLQASIFRTESRGVHYREDFPFRDDPKWLAEVKIKDKDGKMELVRAPLPRKWWPDLKIPYSKRYPLEYLGEEEARKSK